MKQMREESGFQTGTHQLTVINTDLLEAELLIRNIAEKELEAHPRSFDGLSPYVYFKLPYVQPCDHFKELRRLILRIRDQTGLRAHYKGIVAIEVTEWIGHEREEYFTIFLKYLYDHRDHWQTVMVLNDCKAAQMQKFLTACVRYLTPKLIHIRLFEDAASLFEVLQAAFQKCGKRISHDAASMLAEAMINPALKDVRSLEFIERTVAEVIAYSGDPTQITKKHIRDYLLNTCTMMAMISGSVMNEERGSNHEEALYL